MGKRTPELLYKYYGPERVDVVRSLRVRFSQPAALNDPFEFALNISPGEVVRAVKKIGREVANPIRLMRMALGSAWSSKDHEHLKMCPPPVRWLVVGVLLVLAPIFALAIFPFVRRQLLKMTSFAGSSFEQVLVSKGLGAFLVFSCSELWNSVPMWAHYAGNHTGFVIGLDPSHAFENIDRKGKVTPFRPRPVSYVKSLPAIRLDKRGTDAIFGSKFEDWRYEREWRFTALADNAIQRGRFAAGHEILLFDLKKEAVKEVIFGLHASRETITDVQDAFAASGCSPQYYKVSQGEGYAFTRTSSLEVADRDEPCPVPSLVDMFIGPAQGIYEEFKADASAHPIMKHLMR